LFKIDGGAIVDAFIKNGLKSKNNKLVLNVVESLSKLLKTDEDFNCVG